MQFLNVEDHAAIERFPATDTRYLVVKRDPVSGTSFHINSVSYGSQYDLLVSFVSSRDGLVCMMSHSFRFEHPAEKYRAAVYGKCMECSTLDLPAREAYELLLSLIDFDRGDEVELRDPDVGMFGWKLLSQQEATDLIQTL